MKTSLPPEYVTAQDDGQKSAVAIAIARRKHRLESTWEWANIAAHHAEKIGITNARQLLGKNAYPDLSALDSAVTVKRRIDLVIVTRHKGLVDWLNSRGYVGRVIDRVTPADIVGKHVIGKLPMRYAAIAASVTNVSVPGLPEERWREELTADDLDRNGAFMRTYVVKEITSIEPY